MNNDERTAEIWSLLRRLKISPRQASRVMRARGWHITDNIMRDMTAGRWQYAWDSTFRFVVDSLSALTDEIGQTDFETVAYKQGQKEQARRELNPAI